jgi:hypothetical protein
MHSWGMKIPVRTSRQEVADLRAALAACQERASVLAHERDRARELVAHLTGTLPFSEPAAGPRHPVGLAS